MATFGPNTFGPMQKMAQELGSPEHEPTTGITGDTGISLVIRHAEPFFHKASYSFFPVIPVIPVVLYESGN